MRRFAFYSCQVRCLCRDSFGRGGGIPSIFKQPLLCEFCTPDHIKKHSIRLTDFNTFVPLLGLTMNLSLYSHWFKCLCCHIFGKGGGIPSIFKQLLLGKFWSPDHSKKHSIHLIVIRKFVLLLGLTINVLVRLLQSLV
jgi:hypothetical protein